MSSELNWQAPSKRHSKTTKNINIPPSMFLTESYSAFMGKKPRRQRTAGKAVQYLRIRIRESRSSCRSDTIAAIFCGIQPKKAIRTMITAIQKKLSPPPNTRWKREESPLPWPAEAILKLISYSLLSCAAGKNPEPTPAICLYRCRQHHRTAKRRTRQGRASHGLYYSVILTPRSASFLKFTSLPGIDTTCPISRAFFCSSELTSSGVKLSRIESNSG